jgi:lipopolysaccharide biosynthesis glycosyltransferase
MGTVLHEVIISDSPNFETKNLSNNLIQTLRHEMTNYQRVSNFVQFKRWNDLRLIYNAIPNFGPTIDNPSIFDRVEYYIRHG